MTESALVTFEEDVLPLDHESRGVTQRTNRHAYNYGNGSTVVVGGLDNPERTFSTQYDLIAVFECTEATEDDWEKLQRALRNNRIPLDKRGDFIPPGELDEESYESAKFFTQEIADCNPSHGQHWLNKRAGTPKMMRLKSLFSDNPSITEEYLNRLRNLTGIRRSRLYEGRWVAAEGLIWEPYTDETHRIDGSLTFSDKSGKWTMWVSEWMQNITLDWFFASVDWGFVDPGVIHVYGIDERNNAYLIREVYQTGKDIIWWANQAEKLREKYNIQRFVCDPSRPDNIDRFNTRMGRLGAGHIARKEKIAGGANNAVMPGLSVVRERWEDGSLYILRDCLDSRDPELAISRRCLSVADEIPAYCFAPIKEGQATPEGPMKDAEDHGCDTMRYGMMFLDKKDWRTGPQREGEFVEGSWGRILGHDEVEFNTELV